MTLTDKQRKSLWIAAAIVAVIYFAPTVLRQALPARPVAALKPSPLRPSTVPYPAPGRASPTPEVSAPVASAAAVTPADAQFSNLLGIWAGSSIRPNGTICKLRLELRMSQDKPGAYAAYSTMACGPALPVVATTQAQRSLVAGMLNEMRPVSAVASGSVVKGALEFQVDRNIGASPDGCKPTAFTVSPFGASQIAAQWEEGSCQGGQMIMQGTQP